MSQLAKRTLSKLEEQSQPVISPPQEPFTIKIKIRAKDGLTCTVPAILDTGCPVDLVSRWFARQYLCEREKGEGEEEEKKSQGKSQEIHGAKAPRAKLTTSGEWCVPIATTCSQGKAIFFTSFCAGVERDAQLPPIILGMTTLEAQNISLAPRIQSWWQSRSPLPFVAERIGIAPNYNFVAEDSFFVGQKKMPLRVILDTGTMTNGVSIDFARQYLSQVESAQESTWIDAQGKEHRCDGLWELPLRLKSSDEKQRSFTALCWGMDLGEPSAGNHHSVRLSIATLAEQDIVIACGDWSFAFGEEAMKSESWARRLVRSGIEKARSLNEKTRAPNTDGKW
ncbi:unnamed protein product [Clonostachys solani]|uniref:Uncharacterized protein n=1 Tax=Clonostachys solani TaxID=160281 RepID=A0A9N9Z1V6_9HYPO|nr:unnamed protein product [Clonostachys solani]